MKNEAHCPIASPAEVVEMRHGSGGAHSQALISEVFRSKFALAAHALKEQPRGNRAADEARLLVDGLRHDSALVELGTRRLAITTDSYVVTPLFFQGGNIGSLAVFGTCNDLAMLGAEPTWLSAGFILEEGLPLHTLREVVAAMADCAVEANVQIVAGDTKVVERGKGDGVYVTTTGIGLGRAPAPWSPSAISVGDVVIVSGDLGRHGVAVLCAREELDVHGVPSSDCALLWPAVEALLDAQIEVHCLRDLTRGGLGAALLELAQAAQVSIELEEAQLPVCAEVRDFCELIGLDAIYVACEGRFVAVVPEWQAQATLLALCARTVSAQPKVVGRVRSKSPVGAVQIRSAFGTVRPLDVAGAEQLPRIC